MGDSKKLLIRAVLVLALLICIILLALIIRWENTFGEPDNSNREELIFYAGTGDHYYRSQAREFEKQYNIPVRIVVCDEEVYIRKSISESDEERGTIDGMIINSSYQLQQLKRAEVIKGTTGDFVPLYSTKMGFLYDSQVLKHPPVTWNDFNNWIRQNPGKFGFTAVNGEGGFSFIYSLLSYLIDGINGENLNSMDNEPVWQWFRDNRDTILLTSSDYDSLRLFSSGKLQLVTIMEHQVLEALQSGQIPDTVKMYVPEFGSLSEYYGMTIPENAPHREDAKLFSTFLKSDQSVSIMEKMLFVRALDDREILITTTSEPAEPGCWSRISSQLTPVNDILYKRIVDTFKDKVLYY